MGVAERYKEKQTSGQKKTGVAERYNERQTGVAERYAQRTGQQLPAQNRPFTDIRTAARSVSNERLVRRAEQDRAYQIALDNLQREQRKHAEETYKATPMYQRAALYQRYMESPEGRESQYTDEDYNYAIADLNARKFVLEEEANHNFRSDADLIKNTEERQRVDQEISRLQAGKRLREWNDLRSSEDFAEKAAYNPDLYNDYEHQRESLGDDPYEYINANPEVRERIRANQSYGIREDNGWSHYDSRDWSGYDDLPQEVKDTYNYIYNTRGKNEANEYLSAAAPLKATFSESLLAGITAPVANALSIFDDDIAHSTALENARAASGDYSWAYKTGSTASNIASMLLLNKGFAAVGRALGASANLASGAIYNALTMGSQSALSQAPYLRTGQITPEEFGRSVGVNAIAGASASIASGLVSTGINDMLVQKGLQTKFNNYLTNAASSSAYAATNTLTQNALSKKKMTDEELAWSLVEGFAYSLISAAVQTGIQNRQTAEYVERLQKELNDGWEEITRTASQSTGGDNSRAQTIARELLAKAQEGRVYIEQMSMPGQQSAKNDILAGYDLLISNFNAIANGLPQSTQVPAAPSGVVSGIRNALQAGISVPEQTAINVPDMQAAPVVTNTVPIVTNTVPIVTNTVPSAGSVASELSAAPGASNISKADLDRISGEYDGSTDEIVYSRGMVEGYNYGLNGYPKDQITADGFYNDLAPAQREYSYALGQNAAAKNKVTSADTEKKLKDLGVGEEGITAFKDGYTVGTDFDTYYKDFTDGYKTGTVDNILELSGEGAKQAVVDGFSARLRDEESGSLPVAAPEARRADVSLETGKSSYTDIQSRIEALEDAQARTNDPAEIDRIEKEIEELQGQLNNSNSVMEGGSYLDSARKKLASFVDAVKKRMATKSGEYIEPIVLSESMSKDLGDKIESAIGINTTGWKTAFAPNEVEHTEIRHGKNGKADHTMADTSDYFNLLDLDRNFSNVGKGKRNTKAYRNKDGSFAPTVEITVPLNTGEMAVIEAVPDTDSKTVYVLSAYKKGTASRVPNTVSSNSPAPYVQNAVGSPAPSAEDNTPNANNGQPLQVKDIQKIVAGHQITLDEYARSINSQKAKSERGQIVKAVTDAQKQAQLIDKNGTRTIALGIVDNFVEKGAVDYESVRLDTKNPEIAASQVAAYGMLLRDPRFETFRILFTKGDRIISVQSFTSRLVDRAYATKGMLDSIIARRNDLKASGYYLMHNHPSGDPSESGADIAMTRRFSQMVPGFKGHIIVDHNKYSYLNASGYSQGGIQTLVSGKAETFEKRIVDHPLLYDVFNGPDKLAQAAVDLVHSKDVGVLMYCDTKGRLRAIEEVKNTFMKSTDAFGQYLADRKTQLGSSRTFLLMTGGIAWDDATYDLQHLFLRNLIFDIIDRGGRSMYKGDSGLTVNIGGRIEYINGTVRDRMDYNPDGTIGEKAFEVKEEFDLKENAEQTKELVAVHNMTQNELAKSLDLGGLPMPSIAIIKARNGHSEYGDVSIVFNKDSIDPRKDPRNKIYSGDAWTPTFPQIEYKANDKVESALRSKYYDLYRKFGDDATRPLYPYGNYAEDQLNRDGGEAGIIEKYSDDKDMMQLFLLDTKGKGVDPVVVETKTEMTADQKAVSQSLIDTLGENTVFEFNIPKGENPLTYRKSWLAEHEKELNPALTKAYMAAYDLSEADAKYSVEQMKPAQKIGEVRNALKFAENEGVSIKTETDRQATEAAIEKAVDKKAYNKWLHSLFDGLEEKSGIYNGKERYAPMGNHRSFEFLHYEVNLENIVKEMRGHENAETIFGGTSIWGSAAKRFRSISEVKADKERLNRMDQEEYDAIRKGFTERLSEIAQSIIKPGQMKENSWENFKLLDDAAGVIGESVRNNRSVNGIIRTLSKYSDWLTNINEETAGKILTLADDIANMPTEYFEAKPERAVGFNEAAAVILPENTDSAVKNKLSDLGVPVYEYPAGDEEARRNALNNTNALFESQIQYGNEQTAAMRRERLEDMIEGSTAGNRKDYARQWITSINPTDFLNMTLGTRNQNREVFDKMPGEYGSTVNERDFTEDLKKSRQTPYLIVDVDSGEVLGHEGRHRMRALEKQGITSAEIGIEFYRSGMLAKELNGYGNPLETIKSMEIFNQRGTGQSITLSDIMPLNNANKEAIMERYGNPGANVLYEEKAGYGVTDGKKYPFLRDDAEDEVHKVTTDTKYGSEVRLTDHSPSIITSQKNTKDLPLVMKASHVRENILSEAEAKKLGLSIKGKHFHRLGEELYLQVINGLDDVDLAYRGTKFAPKPERRENYFLLVSKIKDNDGNTINVPIIVNEHGRYNNVYIDVNRIATVFGRNDINEYIKKQLEKGYLVRVKNKSIKASESPVSLTGNYGNNASTDNVPQSGTKVNPESEKTQLREEITPYTVPAPSDELTATRRELNKALRELKNARQKADYWKGQTRLTKVEKLTDASVNALAKQYAANTELNKAELAKEIKTLGVWALNQPEDFSLGALRDRVRKLAVKLGEAQLPEFTTEWDDNLKDALDFIKASKIRINRSDLPADFFKEGGEGRKKFNKLHLTISDQGSMDSWYQEAHELYPYLFPEDITNPADQLEHVIDLLDNVLVPTKLLIPTDTNSEEYIDWSSEEIMADLVELTLYGKEKPTFADRKEAEKKEAVARAKQEVRAQEAGKRKEALDKLREQAKEHEQQALDKLREKREKQIQSLKDHYKEIQKNARERKIESADRTRLLNVARRLSKLKTYDVTKDYINSLIGDLDLVSKGITKRSLEDLVSLKAWYDDEVESNPDFIPDELTKKRLDRLSKTRISNMDIQDVRDLTDVLLNIEHALSTSRKFHNKQIRIETYQAGLNTITDLENSGGVKNQSSKRYSAAISLLRPETLALKLVGYNRNSPLYQLTRELSKGENKRIAYQNEAEEMLRPFTSDKDFVKFINSERIEIGGLGENGNQKAVITPNLRMSLYMHSHNDANMRHIMNGGINVPDYRLLSKGKTAEAYARGTRIKLTPTQVRAITLGMTPKERAFADLCRNYYENVSKPALNEVSNDKLGYSIAKVDDYYRIPVNKNFLQTNFGELKKDGTVDGMGFLKERQEGATTPMDLVGLMETINQDIRMHAKYVGLSIPVGDFNRLMSMMVMGYETSVMDTLEKTWGRPAHQYIDDLMSQLQGNGPKSSALDTVRSKYASAVLLGNVGVMVKQAASYPTAAAVLGWGPLTKAMGNFGKLSDHELAMMRKYSPMQIYREKGYGTIELGDIAARKGSVPKLLQGIQKVDILTTRKLFKACEYYVRSNMPEIKYNSEEFWQAVGELHTRVIENTQPNYTTMQRPAILRSKNQMTRALVMFKTQPMQNYNILYESLGEMIAKHRAYKSGGSEADYKQARRGFARAYTSIAVSTVVFAAMQLLWDMFRHKTEEYEDEGEMTIESVAKGLGIKSLASLAGMIPLGGEALTMIENRIDNILSEAGGEAFFNQTEYDLSAPTIDALNSLRTGIEALLDNSVKLSNWDSMSGADREKVLRKIESALEGVGQFAGIPAANVRKLVTALIVNTVSPISGKYMADYVQLRIEKAPAQNKNAYFDLLYEAYKNDRKVYDMLYEDMIGNEAFATSTKSAQDNVDKAIKDRIKADESKSEDEAADDWQKVYDHVSQRNGWENLSVDQQAKVGQEIQKWAEDTGFNANYDKYLNGEAPDESLKDTTSGKIISGGEKKGVDAIGYFSYLSQLMEVDRPNGNGNLGSYDKNEIANALSKTSELSDTAKQYIWETKYPKSKLTYKEYIASEDYKKWKSNK
ncbi:MAG: hypothetical protein IJS22_03460 [Lachnospiraceae bacterium]|nr:hypothetical protein [Lachnospiraceae bacterium]